LSTAERIKRQKGTLKHIFMRVSRVRCRGMAKSESFDLTIMSEAEDFIKMGIYVDFFSQRAFFKIL
jgi:hypothetical protein